MSIADQRRAVAEKYCREQLAIMDGTAEAGIRRIGTEGFENMVSQIVKIMVRNGWQAPAPAASKPEAGKP